MSNIKRTRDQLTQRTVFAVIGVFLFAVLLTVGTVKDRNITETLYSESNIFGRIMGLIGPMPVFAVTVPLAGALVQRSLGCGYGKGAKAVLTAISALLTASLCFLGAKTFTSSDCLDSLIPSTRGNMAVIMPIMLFVFLPLGYAGYRLALKNSDVKLVRRIIMLMIAVTAAYAVQEIIKGTMHRPRPRTVAKNYPGVEFTPWFEKFPYTKELPGKLGIYKDEFASFPSGHSMMSMTAFIGFPALAWIVPAFKGKEHLLAFIGFFFSAAVMFARIIAGAHYLSDVSASGIIMLTVSAVYMLNLKSTYYKEQGGH